MSNEQNAVDQFKQDAPLLKEVAKNPDAVSTLAEQGVELTDEQLDSAIDSVLASPEVNAMLENAAADAADDAKLAQGKPFDPTGTFSGSTQAIIKAPSIGDRPVTYKDFKAFEERVAAAFKHAGFKF